MRSQCRALVFLPPVSGYERPRARWTVPPIFSSRRIMPVGRVMPVFVPTPSSPRRRGASAGPGGCLVGPERLLEVVVATLRAGVHDDAVGEAQLDARDVHAAGARRDREAD